MASASHLWEPVPGLSSPACTEMGFHHEDGKDSSKGKRERGTDVHFDFAFCNLKPSHQVCKTVLTFSQIGKKDFERRDWFLSQQAL